MLPGFLDKYADFVVVKLITSFTVTGFSDKYVTKFLGIDSTSAGHIDKKQFVNDQFR